MAFYEKAWKQACHEGRAPKWQYKDIPGAYYDFGEALVSHQPFLDWSVRREIDAVLKDFGPFETAWQTYCQEESNRRAGAYYDYSTRRDDYGDDGGAGEMQTEVLEDTLNNRAARYEWVRRRVTERLDLLKAEIRAAACLPDCEWRAKHPVIGVYSRSLNAVLPLRGVVLAFCPKCHEPLKEGDVFRSPSMGGAWALKCPACRLADVVERAEKEHGRSASLIPFTDIPLRDVLKGIA